MIPAVSLFPSAHYERIAEAFGARGFFVTQPSELDRVLPEAMTGGPSIVNIMIDPLGQVRNKWASAD